MPLSALMGGWTADSLPNWIERKSGKCLYYRVSINTDLAEADRDHLIWESVEMTGSRAVVSDIEGAIGAQKITDDETCIVISNTTRVAALKLLGSMSRNEYLELKLSEKEARSLEHLYMTLQT